MVRMQIRGGIRWPKNIDFRYVPTPGRRSWGDLRKIIRLAKYGCANRPFYHIEVTKVNLNLHYQNETPFQYQFLLLVGEIPSA